MVSMSASVNLPLHHKVQKFSSGVAHLGGPGKRAVKWLWCGVMIVRNGAILNAIRYFLLLVSTNGISLLHHFQGITTFPVYVRSPCVSRQLFKLQARYPQQVVKVISHTATPLPHTHTHVQSYSPSGANIHPQSASTLSGSTCQVAGPGVGRPPS